MERVYTIIYTLKVFKAHQIYFCFSDCVHISTKTPQSSSWQSGSDGDVIRCVCSAGFDGILRNYRGKNIISSHLHQYSGDLMHIQWCNVFFLFFDGNFAAQVCGLCERESHHATQRIFGRCLCSTATVRNTIFTQQALLRYITLYKLYTNNVCHSVNTKECRQNPLWWKDENNLAGSVAASTRWPF